MYRNQPPCKKLPSSLPVAAVVSWAALALILVLGASSCNSNTASSGSPENRGNAATPASGGRGDAAQDLLTAKSASDPKIYLRAAVPCPVQNFFYNGLDRKTDSAFWTLQCANGQGYLAEIEADVEATVNITSCSSNPEAVTGVKCFEKIR